MKKSANDSATCADTICLSVLNPDSKPAANQPVFYLGETSVLDVKLLNATGSDIALKSGVALDIFFLSLDVGLAGCKINLPGWTLTPKPYSLNLAYTAGSSTTWGQGDANALAFQISGVQSSLTQARAGFFQVNFSGLTGNNIPGRQKMPLGLIAAPLHGNADLDIAVSLGDGGIIYVSQSNGALIENRLLLNIVNKNDAQAVFTGTPGQEGKPVINVAFVYGNTAGALAPDADKSAPQAGSAWKIKAKESISEGNSWYPTDPDPSAKADDPVWVFQPDQTNHQLIGTGASAAVQFEFDHVISQTQPGITLMYIQFSGFKKNDTQRYNDKLFVLPISKEYLPSPGLIHFSSETTYVLINKSSQEVSILLSWNMTGVSSISLEFESPVVPKIPAYMKSYAGTQPPLQYDQYMLKFQGVEFSGSLLATCRAYDANQNFMGDLEQTIEFDFPPVVTLYTGDIQPDGSLLLSWTTEGAATGVTIFSKKYAANGSTPIQLTPGEPLLNNPYYALIANEVPGENSEPCVFKNYKQFGIIEEIKIAGSFVCGVAVSPKGDYAFVSYLNMDESLVAVIDIGNGPPFKLLSPVIVESGAQSIAVSPGGDFVFVTNGEYTVSVIEKGSGPSFKVVQTIIIEKQLNDKVFSPDGNLSIPLPCIAFSPKGDYAFVANREAAGTVSVIDLRSGPPFKTLSPVISGVGSYPYDMAVSPNGDYVFVLDNDYTVSVIAVGSGPTFTVLPKKYSANGTEWCAIAASPKGDFIYLCDYLNSVSEIDIRTGPPFDVDTKLDVENGSPCAIAVSPGGSLLFVGTDNVNTVAVIDIGSEPPKLLSPAMSINNTPWQIAVSPKSSNAFIVCYGGNSVFVTSPVSVSAF